MVLILEIQVIIFQHITVGLIVQTFLLSREYFYNEKKNTYRDSKYIFSIYRKHLLKKIRFKLITRLRLTLSHFKENRFHHNSGNCINPLCTSTSEDE